MKAEGETFPEDNTHKQMEYSTRCSSDVIDGKKGDSKVSDLFPLSVVRPNFAVVLFLLFCFIFYFNPERFI